MIFKVVVARTMHKRLAFERSKRLRTPNPPPQLPMRKLSRTCHYSGLPHSGDKRYVAPMATTRSYFARRCSTEKMFGGQHRIDELRG
jgi:hypothetical protein